MSDTAAIEQRERELKFDVPDGWEMPDALALVPTGGSIISGVVDLESTYYDTDAHALLGSRLTLRRRTGDTDEGWQLKVPDGDARTEIRLPVNGTAVPRQLQQLTLGARRGVALRPVARLRTHRDIRVIVDSEGAPLAEFVLDDVSATYMGGEFATMTRWREVEVELKQDDETFLRRAAKWLRKAGATPSTSTSKLSRALGDGARPPVAPGKTVIPAVRAYLAAQHDAIRTGDLELRRGQDAIHATRVGTRRYRSVLRVFGDLFDNERATALDAELAWYASILGTVRDLQVLRSHLLGDLDELPPELVLGPVAARLNQTFDKEIAQAQRKLATAMRGRRYLALLEELAAWAATPPIVAADRPKAALERYQRRTVKKYQTRLELASSLDPLDPDSNDALHRARKAAKRARYIGELCEPVLGKPARSAAKAAKKVQDRLGDRQDAVVAIGFLRRLGAVAGTTPGENGFTFGILLGREMRRGRLDRAQV